MVWRSFDFMLKIAWEISSASICLGRIERTCRARHFRALVMRPLIDPRDGDVEDDASSTKRRSPLSLAGNLLAEISLPKLALSWTMLFVFPSLLGLTPPLAFAWVSLISGNFTSPERIVVNGQPNADH